MKSLLILLSCFFFLLPSVQAEEVQGLRASFVQERYLSGFSGAIKSSGMFFLYPDKRVVWKTERPFPSEMAITDELVTQIVAGKKTMQLPVSTFPALGKMHAVVEASLSGNIDGLVSLFGVAPTFEENGSWLLNLQAEELGSKLPYREITLRGRDFVQEVKIERLNGDYDLITLFDHSRTSATQLPDFPEIRP